jgi:hypothetical protein
MFLWEVEARVWAQVQQIEDYQVVPLTQADWPDWYVRVLITMTDAETAILRILRGDDPDPEIRRVRIPPLPQATLWGLRRGPDPGLADLLGQGLGRVVWLRREEAEQDAARRREETGEELEVEELSLAEQQRWPLLHLLRPQPDGTVRVDVLRRDEPPPTAIIPPDGTHHPFRPFRN